MRRHRKPPIRPDHARLIIDMVKRAQRGYTHDWKTVVCIGAGVTTGTYAGDDGGEYHPMSASLTIAAGNVLILQRMPDGPWYIAGVS